MKKIIAGIALTVAPMLSVAQSFGPAGCGVGSIIFDGQTGMGPNILAATTNGFYGTQTFAMTSGTLGCDVNQPVVSNTAMYIDANMENIASDISRGQGEALDALASLLSVEQADQAHFATVMQENFSKIYPTSDVTADQVTLAVFDVLRSDTTLAKYAA